MAAGLVPELAAYSELAQLGVLSKSRHMSHEQVLQLGYDDAMQSLAYNYHQNRYQYEHRELVNKPTPP